MKIFGYRIEKAKVNRDPSREPVSPVRYLAGSRRPTVEYRDIVLADMAMSHPVIFRCLNKIASSFQTVDWYCEQDPSVPTAERAPANTVKAINAMLKSPSDNMDPAQLRYWMALTYAVYGRIPFKVGYSFEKMPNAVYPLDARYVRAVTDQRGSIKEYHYGDDETQVFPTRSAAEKNNKLDKGYAHEIATPNLSASIATGKNVSPLNCLGLPADVIRYLLHRAIDTAQGHPNAKYIITAEKTITKKQKEEIVNQIENSTTGEDGSGSILFLYNTDIKVHALDNNLGDIHSKMPMDDMSRMIAGAFGIPISLLGLGAADGAKFAGNYLESRQSFWQDTIIPCYATPIANGLTKAVCPHGARIVFDLDTIEAIKDARVARAKTLAEVPFLTTTEKRELIGFEPNSALPETMDARSAGNKQEPTT